ncbi:GntR family transcriptional regulator [Variovorax ginsengisoli]|uniref:DNA-binding GntR family transcriptional regulator n=1 Tax=Variovorax ginsengisoli TaxID=363844 RepID=A0ABT9SBI7_9BURK|nr:GntR family transcriptional regulator [Variovorax ginsengisoli]MDP9901708.1 DNA-binding GntR family transcriptional regulator [Variovorax ginsengisoli]
MPVTDALADTFADDNPRPPAVRLADAVYRELRDDIFAFRRLPGDRFAENDVAERLKVSRTPVREALMRLQSEGLVRGYFRNGWEVVPIDLSRFAALYELREMIELHAVRRLCTQRRAGTMQDAVLTALGAPWRVAPAERLTDGLAVAALDECFHLALVGAAGNPETDGVYRQVTERIRIMRRLDFAYGDCIDETYEEHGAILDAITAGDAEHAAALTARHIEDSHTVVQQITIERLEQVRTETAHHPAPMPHPTRRKRFG